MISRKSLAFVAVALVALAIGGPGGALADTSSDLLGTWGYIVLGKGGKGSWFRYKTEAGTMTFNEGGSVETSYKESADKCPGEDYCLENANEILTYRVEEGGLVVIEDTIKCFMADRRNVMMCDGTTGLEKKGERFFIAVVKLDPEDNYADSDFLGEYFVGDYEKDLHGETRGYNRLASMGASIVSVDGSVSITSISGYENGDGRVSPVTIPEVPIQVNPDGSFLGDFLTGYVDFNRKIAVISNPSSFYPETGDDFAAFIVMRKQDRSYSTPDLSGRWAFAGFGDKAGTARAEIGTITCDSQGHCTFSMKVANVNGSAKFSTATRTLTVSEDGSINGFYLTANKPHLSGAIGNDGNTMILLMNESAQTTNDRLLGVAVKNCNGTVPGFPDLAVTEVAVTSTAKPGEKIAISYKIENQGEAPTKKAAQISLRLLDEAGSLNILLGTKSVPKLNPGDTVSGSKTIRLKRTLTPGEYTVKVVVDPTNAIIESREDNDEGTAPLTIQ